MELLAGVAFQLVVQHVIEEYQNEKALWMVIDLSKSVIQKKTKEELKK